MASDDKMTIGHFMVISETITKDIFNTIEDADAFADKFMEKLPAEEKHHYHANYCIKNRQFIVKIKRSDFRLGVSLIQRTCPQCGGHVEYWSFNARNINTSREEREKLWLNPLENIFCYHCYYWNEKTRKSHNRTNFVTENKK